MGLFFAHFKRRIKSIHYDFFFIILLAISAFLFQYFDILNTPPNGIHTWRQSDGASIAYIFYEEGNSFFSPEMHNRLSGEGKAVGEFPLMYYLVSIFYHIFGFHHWVYRAVWSITTLTGIFFLYKFSFKLLKNHFWAILVSLGSFASPVLAIYGISYIPDPIALSFLFISWYFLYSYIEDPKPWNIVWSILFISLAALLKVTSLISIISFVVTIGIVMYQQSLRDRIAKLYILKKLWPFLIVMVLALAWYIFASVYNKEHETNYFFMEVAPIWNLNPEDLSHSMQMIMGWYKDYYYPSGLHALYVMAALILLPLFNSKLGLGYYLFYVISILGTVGFLLLFYMQLIDHNYYIINVLFIIPLTYLFFLKKYLYWIGKNNVIKNIFSFGFLFLIVLNIYYAHNRTEKRFAIQDGWLDKDLYELRDRLSEYGISKEELILVPHDPSPNITLYALNMKGWTALNGIRDPRIMQQKIAKGAKYIVVSDPRFYDNSIIDPYRDNLIADFKGIRIYEVYQ